MNKFKNLILAHKLLSGFAALLIIWGGYYFYGKAFPTVVATRYVVAAAQKETVVLSVSGSGQVSALSQIDIKPKVSGDVIYVAGTQGHSVAAGELILQLDSADAQKTVRDAKAGLESAQISLAKLIQPTDALSLIQAENALSLAKQSAQNSEADLAKAYDDGFSAISNTFLDVPGVMTGLDSVLNGFAVKASQSNIYAYYDMVQGLKPNADQYRDSALNSYQTARTAYEKNFNDYKTASRYSDKVTIDALLSETYATSKSISEAVKNAKNFLDFVSDALSNSSGGTKPPTVLASQQSTLQTYTGTLNNSLANLLNAINAIKNDNDSIINTKLSITEKTEALNKLKNGPDPLDIKSSELAVTQKQNAVLDANQNLANYYIRSPFAGVLAKLSVNKGDPASPGTSVATVITSLKIAEISLNEVDIAKVKVGQKATLTFDAFPDLTIIGNVAQVDTIGTVSQGVVNYSVKISFETQDDRVKSGMSVSAAVITDVKTDILAVPSAAVKSQGGGKYVEILDSVDSASLQNYSGGQITVPYNLVPSRKNISIGLSGDSYIEVTDGLSGGEMIVLRVISTSTAAQSATGAAGGIRIPGLGGR